MLLLLVGASRLLKWKPSGRPMVMLWAVLIVIVNFSSGILWIVQFARDVSAAAATTQPIVHQPIWQMIVFQLLWCIDAAFLPLLIWLILGQPEVVKLFTHTPTGGFEVVPMAQAVAPTNDAAHPTNG